MKMERSLKEHLIDFYLHKSNVFCMMPWIHIHSWPDSRVFPCCLGNIENPLGHLNESLKGVWNNANYKLFRHKLINNLPIPEYCQHCYEFDKTGGDISLRRSINNKFGKYLYDILDNTDPDGTYHEFKLKYIDFRYSNLCNLKCRSCCHELSSRWYKDTVDLYGDPGVPMIRKPKNQGYIDEVLETLPYIDSVYFAGGEPLIQHEHYFMLEKLKEIGRTDVDLIYATNFTTLSTNKYDVLKYWEGFKSVDLMASLDASWKRGELMRKGVNWNIILENRRRIAQNRPKVGTFTFKVCTTVSAMNVFHVPELHRELIDQGFIKPYDIWINPLISPEHYCAQILPKEYKSRIEKHYMKFAKEYLSSYSEQSKRYESLLSFIWEKDLTDHLPKFISSMKRLDEYRGESFIEVFPEWKELFNACGN